MEVLIALGLMVVYVLLLYLLVLYVLAPLKLWYCDDEPFIEAFKRPWRD